MPSLKAIRVRLYPTPEQTSAFAQIAGCCRLVYNLGLEQRRDFWRQKKRTDGTGFTWYGQKRELKDLKRDGAPFLADVPVHCLQMALKDLDTAYRRFFEGAAGHPRPRRKGDHDSFVFPDPAQITLRVSRGELVLPKFGKTTSDWGAIKARFHRMPYGEIRSVTISRDGAHWVASILTRVKRDAPRPVAPASLTADDVEGIDRGVAVAAMASDGASIVVPRETERQRRRGTRLARALARTQHGSKRRERARKRLLAHKARHTRRRNDARHKGTRAVVNRVRVVGIEALNVKGMSASARGSVDKPGRGTAAKAGLNRSILETGWGEIRRQLAYKLAWKGGHLVEVDARHTSQACAACGHIDPENRKNQGFLCLQCGHVDHADRTAARNIKARTLDLIGVPQTRPPERDPGCPGKGRIPEGTVGTARGELGGARSSKREDEAGTHPATKINVNQLVI